MVAHNYCYLRDLQAKRWQSFGIQDLRIRELQSSLGVIPPPATGALFSAAGGARGSHYCNHCQPTLPPGNNASCLWKTSIASEPRTAGATALRRLGEGADPIEDDE